MLICPYVDDVQQYIWILERMSNVVKALTQCLKALYVRVGRKILKISLEKTAWLCLFGSQDLEIFDHGDGIMILNEVALPHLRFLALVHGTGGRCGQEGFCTGTPCASVAPFPGLEEFFNQSLQS